MLRTAKAMMLLVIAMIPQLAVPQSSPPQKQVQLNPSPQLLRQIKKNHPKIDTQFARKLAVVVEDVSKKYKIKADKLLAIARQESAYDLNAKNCYVVKGKMRCDYCMMQINDKTIKAFGFDQKRLMTDVRYCVEAGAKVLQDFRHMYGSKEDDYWTRYNSSNDEKREIYRLAVSRWF
jgi:soluble lytic murein transglycosylase-like protein